ncbi:S66 family peptidase [Photobacterium sanctipauli]|uniref:S66 family peptidase n=1 Tax=Photobacterium sanctipauli TaxID=1342794 RepID=UPI000AAD7143|nr:S66 peptidase family protein [Photobacterium sanctipauli]
MAFLCDDSIAAIMPPWGGEFAMDILPLLDYKRLSKAKPKWVIGFSDVSTLMVTLTTKLVHAANLMQLHPSESELLTSNTLHWLSLNEGTEFTQFSTKLYERKGESYAANPNALLNLTEPTEWKVIGTSANANFSGRLIGGCFDTMTHLIGTDYFDLLSFCEQYQNDGVILYLENAEMSPTVLKRALLSLKYQGVFDCIKGLMFGRNAVLEPCGKSITALEALTDVASSINIPVIYDVDIGHLPPNLTLFNGAYAEVTVSSGKGKIQQVMKP